MSFFDIAKATQRAIHEHELNEVNEHKVDLERDPCIECDSTTWRLAVDGVCSDCLHGYTRLRRNGAPI